MSEPRGLLHCDCLALDGPEALTERGPLIRVSIGPAPDDEESRKAAKKLAASAVLMIDTGAHNTLIDEQVLQQFGLPATRTATIVGIFPEPRECLFYQLAITIPLKDDDGRPHSWVTQIEVGGLPRAEGRFYMGLLGRDCLQGLQLVYDGPKGIAFLAKDSHLDPDAVVPLPQAARSRHRRR